ncbi:serine O-acetyltransferase [Sphingomonas quercus]|uniref:Serine acetyltransferase n=1 Tax=Sphingomonas quercus TaxID=2842451 RepID=A0ABS6BFX3_9SPHN|nr:serine acetyltransferase [Sphingomonas quercus]MBU3077191.1 serine acetyltransferase [Sphingomonas quercus]
MSGLFTLIAEDWRANGRDWTRPGFRTLAAYRFGVWRMGVRPKLLRAPLSFVYRMMFRHCRNVYGIELPWSAKVGRGVVIEHQGGIVIHGASVIGDRCIIRQNCTLGLRRLDDLTAAPVLEEGVELGAGAVLLGRITLGRGARVGANAVVVHDVAPGVTVSGIPARPPGIGRG